MKYEGEHDSYACALVVLQPPCEVIDYRERGVFKSLISISQQETFGK